MTFKKGESKETALPSSFYAEQAILTIFLTYGNSKNLWKEYLNKLKKEIFYYESHKLIYESILELWEKKIVINLTTVISKLQDNGNLKKIGGIEKILEIINRLENFVDLDQYIEIANEKYIRRLIIQLGKESIRWSYSSSMNVEEILEKIENSVENLSQQQNSEEIENVAQVLDEIYQEMKIKKQYGSGFLTSFKDFDSIIQGFEKSDLIIIAGRPSMGKTAFSLNLGKNIVEKYKVPLIIFSLEMSRQQILYRLIASESNINSNRLKSGKMTLEEINKLKKTMYTLSKMPIFIDDNPNLTLNDIRSKIKKIFVEKNQNGIIIIDYLQLMKLNSKLENRVQEISYLTRNLKLLAKEFKIPIFLLSQLSRNVESRVNKRPMLSDLRESGCITNNAIDQITNLQAWDLNRKKNLKTTDFEFKGIKPTYFLTFSNQFKLELSANHKILSEKGWIRVSEINLDTKIYSLETENKVETSSKWKLEKIQNIEYKGLYSVFDQTIPIFHNYIWKNFILHNSIEQDADIVIMLYREDYYTQKTTNSQITELIIAKHRNGQLGTTKILFYPSTTKFTNMENNN